MSLSIHIPHFSKGKETLFSAFEWTVHQQENWAIFGDIGTGKTILLKLLDGSEYLPNSNGQITYSSSAGKEALEFISFSDTKKWIKLSNYYYQQRYYTSFTEDEISLHNFICLEALSDIQQEKTAVLLEQYHLQSLLYVPFIQLSNGQKNKAILIKALQSPCSTLLLDNPFIGIDAGSRQDIFSLMDTLIKERKQVIYTTNYAEFAASTTHILHLKEAHKYAFYKKEDFIPKTGIPIKIKGEKKNESYSSEKIIEMKDVVVEYKNNIILDHINWTVRKGEKWAIMGANGSGKSTLMSFLYADHPQSYKNSIWLFNQTRQQQSIWEIKAKIGYLSPEFHMHFNESMPVVQVVGSGFFDTLSLLKKLSAEQIERIDEVLQRLQISYLKERNFMTLSFGEQRLVLFARAIIKKPSLLILDEPYQGLDCRTIERCNQLLNTDLTNEHTLIFTAHYTEEIPDCINKFLHLENGKIITPI